MALAGDEDASLPPAGQLGNEVCRARDLDVDLKLFFQARQGPEERVPLGHDQDVGIDRRVSPTDQHGGGPSRQVEGLQMDAHKHR
jgi:hypothetical protein